MNPVADYRNGEFVFLSVMVYYAHRKISIFQLHIPRYTNTEAL